MWLRCRPWFVSFTNTPPPHSSTRWRGWRAAGRGGWESIATGTPWQRPPSLGGPDSVPTWSLAAVQRFCSRLHRKKFKLGNFCKKKINFLPEKRRQTRQREKSGLPEVKGSHPMPTFQVQDGECRQVYCTGVSLRSRDNRRKRKTPNYFWWSLIWSFSARFLFKHILVFLLFHWGFKNENINVIIIIIFKKIFTIFTLWI